MRMRRYKGRLQNELLENFLKKGNKVEFNPYLELLPHPDNE